MEKKYELQDLPDSDLLLKVTEVLKQSRRVESVLVAHIAEVDARGLFVSQASSSMHKYCTDVLNLSDAEAFLRITAARASRRYPVLLKMLDDGRLHLSGLAVLAPKLKTVSYIRTNPKFFLTSCVWTEPGHRRAPRSTRFHGRCPVT